MCPGCSSSFRSSKNGLHTSPQGASRSRPEKKVHLFRASLYKYLQVVERQLPQRSLILCCPNALRPAKLDPSPWLAVRTHLQAPYQPSHLDSAAYGQQSMQCIQLKGNWQHTVGSKLQQSAAYTALSNSADCKARQSFCVFMYWHASLDYLCVVCSPQLTWA